MEERGRAGRRRRGREAQGQTESMPGKYDLVLHPSHLWLTIHESVGHPTELDRALWWEANYAGTSFLTRDKIGKLQFGSKIVNFVADRTQRGGLATVGYDDEGVPGQKWHLVKDGVFVDWQTTRDLAAMSPQKKSYGCLQLTVGAAFRFHACQMSRCNLERITPASTI